MSTELEQVRRLIRQFGWNTTCFQIVHPGFRHWFSARGDAVIGFVRHHGVHVVAGAPVCSLSRLPEVIEEFEAGRRHVCYFGAEDRLKGTLSNLPQYSTVSLGSQPVWTPSEFVRRFDSDASLRAQRSRAINKGVSVREWSAAEARGNPHLRTILGQWLATRGLPPLHFLVESQTLDHLEGRRLFVAEQGQKPVGFVTLCPAPARRSWLTEQFVRGFEAPNGTIELALWHAVRTIAESDAEMVTMGIVPLSSRATASQNPAWLNGVTHWAKAHGRRFYHFDGLEWFKDKFHPERWEGVYVVSRESQFSPRTLWAIGAAFTEGSPAMALTKGLFRAARTEFARS